MSCVCSAQGQWYGWNGSDVCKQRRKRSLSFRKSSFVCWFIFEPVLITVEYRAVLESARNEENKRCSRWRQKLRMVDASEVSIRTGGRRWYKYIHIHTFNYMTCCTWTCTIFIQHKTKQIDNLTYCRSMCVDHNPDLSIEMHLCTA